MKYVSYTKYIGYLKLKSKLRKSNQTRNILLLIPLMLIVVLFTFNTLMNQQEQAFKEKKYEEREKEAIQWKNDLATDSFNETPNIKHKLIERTDNQLDTIKLLRSSDFSKQLKNEIKELDAFNQTSSLVYSPEENPNIYYGFSPSIYTDIKKINNERLVQLNIEPDSIRYGTKTTTFLVSISLYLTGGFGIIYFLLLFSYPSLKERENKKYQWLAVQPLNRSCLFFLDYLDFMIQSSIYYLFLLFFSFLLPLILGKGSRWIYPLITYTNTTNNIEFIPIWKYLLIVSTLFILNLSLSYFVMHLLFSFLKKSFSSLLLSTFFLTVLFLCSSTPFPNQLNQSLAWQPLIYYAPSQTLIGNDYDPITEIQIEYSSSEPETDTYKEYSSVFYPENINYYSGNNLLNSTRNKEIHYIKGFISLIMTNFLLFIITIKLFVKRMCD